MGRFANSYHRPQRDGRRVGSPLLASIVILTVLASTQPLSAWSQRSALSSVATVSIVVPGYTWTRPSDVNNRGDVVGSANNCDPEPGVGFIYRDGVYTIISFPGATETHLTDINERGVAIGYAWVASASGALVAHSFIVDDGVITPVAPSDTDVLANGINARGDIVGVIPRRTFVRDPRGRFAILDPPPGVDAIFGAEVTASGTIVGTALLETDAGTRFAGFVVERGHLTLLSQFTEVADVNDRGDLLATEGFALPRVYRAGAAVTLPAPDRFLFGISNSWAVGATFSTRPGDDGPCFDAVGYMTRLPGGAR